MELYTERLILRHWHEDDAEELFKYASDPKIGMFAGWSAHKEVEDSRNVIKTILSKPWAYAVVLKQIGKPIGCIGIKLCVKGNKTNEVEECEIGYWIGHPYWGYGLIPEAVQELQRYVFEELKMTKIWLSYFEGNTMSKRVQEKCGFRYISTNEVIIYQPSHEKKIVHSFCLTKEEWLDRGKNSVLSDPCNTVRVQYATVSDMVLTNICKTYKKWKNKLKMLLLISNAIVLIFINKHLD